MDSLKKIDSNLSRIPTDSQQILLIPKTGYPIDVIILILADSQKKKWNDAAYEYFRIHVSIFGFNIFVKCTWSKCP